MFMNRFPHATTGKMANHPKVPPSHLSVLTLVLAAKTTCTLPSSALRTIVGLVHRARSSSMAIAAAVANRAGESEVARAGYYATVPAIHHTGSEALSSRKIAII